MNIVTAILNAVAALAGPFRDMLVSLYQEYETFHTNGDVTPDQLALEALKLAPQVMAMVADTKTQIAMISQALQESHSDLTPAHATSVAAAAVVHSTK